METIKHLESGGRNELFVGVDVGLGSSINLLLESRELDSVRLSKLNSLLLVDGLGSNGSLSVGLLDNLGVWVESVKVGRAAQRVDLSGLGSDWLSLSSLQNALDFVRVNDLGDVRVLEEGGIESVARLEG